MWPYLCMYYYFASLPIHYMRLTLLITAQCNYNDNYYIIIMQFGRKISADNSTIGTLNTTATFNIVWNVSCGCARLLPQCPVAAAAGEGGKHKRLCELPSSIVVIGSFPGKSEFLNSLGDNVMLLSFAGYWLQHARNARNCYGDFCSRETIH